MFQKESTVENMKVASRFFDMHPRADTVRLAGCPLTTGVFGGSLFRDPGGAARYTGSGEGAVPTLVYDLLGKPIWSGLAHPGRIPHYQFPQGRYLLSQGSLTLLFRVPAP
jgi:hypothetical protein